MATETGSAESSARKVDSAAQKEIPMRSRGKTYIEDDVISVIARIAAEQVPGVYQIGDSSLRNLLSRLGSHHGVEAESGLKEAAADLEIIVELGHPIRDVTEEMRERVIETVESMTGRKMVEVNIFVVDVHVPKTTATKHRRELE
ncbi:MAG: Asp23/Gls24 family envelope stress response protein [Polyangia bacterium]